MEKRLLVHFLFLFSAFSLLLPLLAANASAINLCRWQGYANISNTSASTSNYITVHNGTKTYNATIYSSGFYIADVEAPSTGVTISFKICGIDAIQGGQAWSCPATDYNTLNLSVVALSSGASCTYSCACSGGYCCSGATEYTAGEGTGACQASACAAAATTTTAAPSHGGGGVATTTTTLANVTNATTTTTTIPLPPKEETETIANIPANGTGGFKFTETAITDINVTTTNDVNNPAIKVVQSSSKPATVVISASNAVYGYLTITKTNIIDADVSNVKIRFKVAKSWISGNRVDESTVTLSRYSLGVWTALQTTKTGDDGTYVYFEAVSPGLSVFAISAVQRALPTFWNIVTYIDNYYKGQITFWSLIGHISDYYTG
jgi:PGF-pre-PGF domain-containing protein